MKKTYSIRTIKRAAYRSLSTWGHELDKGGLPILRLPLCNGITATLYALADGKLGGFESEAWARYVE